MTSEAELRSFIEAASGAFKQFAQDPASRRTVGEVFASLEEPGSPRSEPGHRLPACSNLEAALSVRTGHESLRRLLDGFAAIEPLLRWRRRADPDGSASKNFEDGHANALVVGPGGLVDRHDAWLGVSLLAPNVRYPNHTHSPEEVYLVLSEGEFRHGDTDWFSPGIGGSFYNEPGITHAMRSGAHAFAFWVLQPKPSESA